MKSIADKPIGFIVSARGNQNALMGSSVGIEVYSVSFVAAVRWTLGGRWNLRRGGEVSPIKERGEFMAQVRVWSFAILLAICMLGCSGSEYRFGNARTLPNVSGQWGVIATSQSMSQQFAGSANLAQTNLGLQGSVNLPFSYCGPAATLSGLLESNSEFTSTSLTSYTVSMTLQENVPGNSGSQPVNLTGSVSADGTHMSGQYTVPPGPCTQTGDSGVWTADLNTSPPNLNISGTWGFTAKSEAFQTTYTGSGSLQQSGNVVTGQTSLSGTPCATTAAATGVIVGSVVTLELNENGQLTVLTGALDASHTFMSGRFASSPNGCTNGDFGTWSATSQ